MTVTLIEALSVVHLLITLFLAYKLGKVTTEIETLYEAVAATMEGLNLTKREDLL